MTTKERLHHIIEETPEQEIPRTISELFVFVVRALEALSQNPDFVRTDILNSAKWQEELREAAEDSRAGRGVPKSEVFVRLQKR